MQFAKENFNQSCHQLQEELEQQSPDPLSVTCIGIGKKDSGLGGGFLARMVAKGESIVSKKTAKVEAPMKNEDLDNLR